MWQKLLIGFLGLFLLFRFGMIGKRVRPIDLPIWVFGDYWKLKSYIEAMAIHESGNYTNTLSREYFNIFNMICATQRKVDRVGCTPQTDEFDNQKVSWTIYNSYYQAVRDLRMWFEVNKFPLEVSSTVEMAQELRNRGFYTAPLSVYVNGLNNALKTL